MSRNRKSCELVARFNPAYSANTVEACGSRHRTECRQNKFDLQFRSHGRSSLRQDKHSTFTNVHAVASVVVAPAVGPAEQEWQRYFKSPRIPSLDGSIHIRTQFPSAGLLTISATRERHKRVIVLGTRGRVCD